MRVYHFLSTKNALDDLARRHIRISELDELNDPFELWCSAQDNPGIRRALRGWKKEMAQKYGMLCFCRHWRNPLLWSLYADKHRGVCLGFDVDEVFLTPVSYVKKRTDLELPPTQEAVRQLLYTKYRDWSYEEELRCWVRLDERDESTGYYFHDFDENVRVREVIAGPLCDEPRAAFDAALKGYEDTISVMKARLAFRTFGVAENKRGFNR